MEETNTQNSNTPTKAGKGLGVAGFVVSLVALILWMPISAAAVFSAAFGGGMGLSGFWLIVSLLGLVFSILGLMKANKGGGKKGMAIAGLVIGLIASSLAVSTVIGVKKAQTEFEKAGLGGQFMETFQKGMEQGLDSLSNQMKGALDSVKTPE